jgi:hypothetical protein
MKSSQAAALPPTVMVAIVVLGAVAVFSFTLFFGTHPSERGALTPRDSQDMQPIFADRDVTALDCLRCEFGIRFHRLDYT